MEFICFDCKASTPVAQLAIVQRRNFEAGKGQAKPRCLACRAKRREVRAAGLRLCSVCKIAKSPKDFSPTGSGWLSDRCRPCAASLMKARKAAIRESATHFVCCICRISKTRDSFNKGRMRRCKECIQKKKFDGRNSEYGRFRNAQNIAWYRNMEWLISQEEYSYLRSKPCAYCGFPLPASGVGLDRIDADGPYMTINVLPCCTDCNLAKGARFDAFEMKMIGEVIRQIKISRNECGLPVSLGHGWRRTRHGQGDNGCKHSTPQQISQSP